jgi:hypothetical protein
MKLIPASSACVDDPDCVVVIGVAEGAEHHRAQAHWLTETPVRPSGR